MLTTKLIWAYDYFNMHSRPHIRENIYYSCSRSAQRVYRDSFSYRVYHSPTCLLGFHVWKRRASFRLIRIRCRCWNMQISWLNELSTLSGPLSDKNKDDTYMSKYQATIWLARLDRIHATRELNPSAWKYRRTRTPTRLIGAFRWQIVQRLVL